MTRTDSRTRYSVGRLVDLAYEKARRMTADRLMTAVVASVILEEWLARSNRPDLVNCLRADR